MRTLPAAVLALVLGLTSTGCGDSRFVQVSGRILQDGGAVPLRKGEDLSVQFVQLQGDSGDPAALYNALVNNDGSFTVPGGEGKGILPGRYRVAIGVHKGALSRDKFRERFATDKSPFIVDVSHEKSEFDIDLAKPPK